MRITSARHTEGEMLLTNLVMDPGATTKVVDAFGVPVKGYVKYTGLLYNVEHTLLVSFKSDFEWKAIHISHIYRKKAPTDLIADT